MKLQLGELRDPDKRKRVYITSVHEAGHAIVFAWRKGIAPDNIVSTSIDRGGFCSTYDKEFDKEITTRHEADDDVMISMAGYLAEEVIYGDRPEMMLLGSKNDIEDAWVQFSNFCFTSGYFEPILFAADEHSTAGPTPSGIDHYSSRVRYFNGQNFINLNLTLPEAIQKRFWDLREETLGILETEKELIKVVALELGKVGYLSGEQFLELVEGYGTEFIKE